VQDVGPFGRLYWTNQTRKLSVKKKYNVLEGKVSPQYHVCVGRRALGPFGRLCWTEQTRKCRFKEIAYIKTGSVTLFHCARVCARARVHVRVHACVVRACLDDVYISPSQRQLC
jgi:hypothetical protein